MKKPTLSIIFCLVFASLAWTQSKTVTFDPQKPLDYIKVLADDAMEGRMSGLPGAERAARYIADKLKEWGVEPAGDGGTYFQKFDLEDFFHIEPGAELAITVEGRTRKLSSNASLFDEWSVCRLSGSADVEAEIVFAGYGIHSPEKGYDDYAGLDVKGKIVLIADGFPQALQGVDPSIDIRIKTAREMGAKVLILAMPPTPYGQEMVYPASCTINKETYTPDFAVVGINQAALDFVFSKLKVDVRDIIETMDKKLVPHSFATGTKARVKVKTIFLPKAETANVLGKITGTDPKLKSEIVLMGAHMDHLGNTPDGDILNGANDNASGTAVVMEVARLMKQNKIRPRRTIVFALWAAEEQGLFGSKHYVEHPVFPLDKTAVDINLDMVGQGGDVISVGGVYFCPAVWAILEKDLPKEAFDGIVTRRGLGGSDCLPFVQTGVPAFHIIGGGAHYKGHAPGDDWPLISPQQLERAERFVYHAASVLAETPKSIFSPHFRGLTLVKNNEIINCAAVPLETAIREHKDVINPDVDWQLVYPEFTITGSPAADREAALEALAALPGKLENAPGLSFYGLPAKNASRTSRGNTLILGLDNPSLIADNPSWLISASKLGVKYVRVRTSDLILDGADLNKKTQDMIQGIQKAGCLIIADGVEGAIRTALLKAAVKPLILISDVLPSGDDIKSVKEGRHVIALRFPAAKSPESYAADLKAGREALGARQILMWNESSLWDSPAMTSVIRLAEILQQDSWNVSESRHGETTDLGRVLSGNFLNILRGRGEY